MERALDPVFPACALSAQAKDRIATRAQLHDLVIVLALPKSASTAFTRSCALLLEATGSGRVIKSQEAIAQGGMTRSIAISFSVLHDEELKGAWQVHAPFSFTSIELMRLFRVPYVVLARHPLDHLIALACHWRKSRMVGVIQRHMSAGRPLVNTALAPVTVDTLCAKQVADVVKGLISEGYLFHVLSWLANWLGSRDVANSVMIRMECLNENPGFWFDQMANLLKVGENESRAASAMYTREFSARRSAANDTDEYPHGWTGAGQLWRSYCSEREIDAYNLGVRSFLTATPHRNALFGAFEDLLVE